MKMTKTFLFPHRLELLRNGERTLLANVTPKGVKWADQFVIDAELQKHGVNTNNDEENSDIMISMIPIAANAYMLNDINARLIATDQEKESTIDHSMIYGIQQRLTNS